MPQWAASGGLINVLIRCTRETATLERAHKLLLTVLKSPWSDRCAGWIYSTGTIPGFIDIAYAVGLTALLTSTQQHRRGYNAERLFRRRSFTRNKKLSRSFPNRPTSTLLSISAVGMTQSWQQWLICIKIFTHSHPIKVWRPYWLLLTRNTGSHWVNSLFSNDEEETLAWHLPPVRGTISFYSSH